MFEYSKIFETDLQLSLNKFNFIDNIAFYVLDIERFDFERNILMGFMHVLKLQDRNSYTARFYLQTNYL